MEDISKHHTKKEWESYSGEYCRVDFFVSGNSVCVYNLLKGPSEFVRLYVSRLDHRLFVELPYVMNLRPINVPS
jgi:hypothetical protein